MSLRSIAKNPKNLFSAFYNVFVMRNYDGLMRKMKGQKWIDWKNDQAILRTNGSRCPSLTRLGLTMRLGRCSLGGMKYTLEGFSLGLTLVKIVHPTTWS